MMYHRTKYASAEDAAVERERRDRRDHEVLTSEWVAAAIQGHPERIERVRAPRPRLRLLLADMDRIEARWAREGFRPGKRIKRERARQRAKMEAELARGAQRELTLLRELVAAYEVELGQREFAPAQHLVGYCRDLLCTACGRELNPDVPAPQLCGFCGEDGCANCAKYFDPARYEDQPLTAG